MSRMEELEAAARRIESEIIAESEAERKRQAKAYQRKLKEEAEASKRRLEESKRETEAALLVKAEKDRLSAERSRAEYSHMMTHFAEILPPPSSMPRCADCGQLLVFQNYPPYSEGEEVNLFCPNCRMAVRSKMPANPFRVAEVSSPMLFG